MGGGGMDAVRAMLICVAGALVCATLRVQRPEFRLAVAIAAGLAALAFTMDGIASGVDALTRLAGEAGLAGETTGLMMRATGITVLAEFGAQLCRDAGESALAGRVELAGRTFLLTMAAPLLTDLVGRIAEILP